MSGTEASFAKGQCMSIWPLTSGTTATRLTLSTSNATANDLVAGGEYKFSLTPGSSDAAFIELDTAAVAPASGDTAVAGFWLMPGESELVVANGVNYAGIMLSGTGTLLVTRLR
jgi:hypothetical protein